MLKIEILKEPRVYDYDIFGLPPGLHVNLHFAITSLVYSFWTYIKYLNHHKHIILPAK